MRKRRKLEVRRKKEEEYRTDREKRVDIRRIGVEGKIGRIIWD